MPWKQTKKYAKSKLVLCSRNKEKDTIDSEMCAQPAMDWQPVQDVHHVYLYEKPCLRNRWMYKMHVYIFVFTEYGNAFQYFSIWDNFLIINKGSFKTFIVCTSSYFFKASD